MEIVLVMPSSPSGSFFCLFFCQMTKTEPFSPNAEVETCWGNSTRVFLEEKRNHFLISSSVHPVTSLGLLLATLCLHTRMEFCDSSSGTSEAVGRVRSSTPCLFDSFGLTSGPWSLTIPASHQREVDGKGPRSSPCSYCRRSSLDSD